MSQVAGLVALGAGGLAVAAAAYSAGDLLGTHRTTMEYQDKLSAMMWEKLRAQADLRIEKKWNKHLCSPDYELLRKANQAAAKPVKGQYPHSVVLRLPAPV